MPKAIWSIIVAGSTAVTAILSAMYQVGDWISHQSCDPHQSEFVPWDIGLVPTFTTAFFASVAGIHAYFWRKDGVIINGARIGFLLLSLLYSYAFIDQTRLFDFHYGVFTSCLWQDWNDLAFFELAGLFFFGLPILTGAMLLTSVTALAITFFRKRLQ